MGPEDSSQWSMPFHMVVSDLDGTLLGPNEKLHPLTLSVVARLRIAGIMLVLATARRYVNTAPVAGRLGFKGPLVLYDGAQTRDYPSGDIMSTLPLDRDTAAEAAAIFAAYDLQPVAQYSDAGGEYLRVAEAPRSPFAVAYLSRFGRQAVVVPLRAVVDNETAPVRVVAFGPVPLLRRAAVAVHGLACARQLLLRGSYGTGELTIFAPAASKGSAMRHLAGQGHIPTAKILAIGDSNNDISMLRAAGLGIAMPHAPRRVRATARVLAPAFADGGAAAAIQRYALGSLPL